MTESLSPTINVETMSHAEAIACVQRLLKRLESWDALEKIILQQQEEITQLKARLSKDSHNSSKPPSSDGLARRAKSLRTKTGAKAGGQVGHVGSTLKKSSRIDHVIVHQLPRQCGVCGHSFNGMSSHEEAETRQVIDLPALRFEITEHRILRVQCRCGAQTCSSFPAEVISAVQYGPTIRAAAVYLNQYQQVPYQRCAAALQDLFGLRIAASSVVNYVRQVAAALRPEVAKIKETLLTQAAVHFDETGLRQGKTLVWTHSASTACLTWYGVHQKRGSEAINDFNILPRFKGVAIHDGMKSYRQYSCSHGLCNAHHLRELLFIFETTGEPWARAMMHLLCEAKELKSSLQCDGKELDSTQIKDIEQSYIRLLGQGMKAHPEKKRKASAPRQRGQVKQSDATNLLRRLFDYSDDVLRFTSDPHVPFDNNQAERDLRMIKLKQKISGCFRSWEGVDYFCTIRSYLSTLHKNKQNLYEALTQTFNGRAPAAV